MNRTAETVETQWRLSELETGVLQKLSCSWLAFFCFSSTFPHAVLLCRWGEVGWGGELTSCAECVEHDLASHALYVTLSTSSRNFSHALDVTLITLS